MRLSVSTIHQMEQRINVPCIWARIPWKIVCVCVWIVTVLCVFIRFNRINNIPCGNHLEWSEIENDVHTHTHRARSFSTDKNTIK